MCSITNFLSIGIPISEAFDKSHPLDGLSSGPTWETLLQRDDVILVESGKQLGQTPLAKLSYTDLLALGLVGKSIALSKPLLPQPADYAHGITKAELAQQTLLLSNSQIDQSNMASEPPRRRALPGQGIENPRTPPSPSVQFEKMRHSSVSSSRSSPFPAINSHASASNIGRGTSMHSRESSESAEPGERWRGSKSHQRMALQTSPTSTASIAATVALWPPSTSNQLHWKTLSSYRSPYQTQTSSPQDPSVSIPNSILHR